MSLQAHFVLMARYNQWMNAKVYDAASRLSAAELAEERGAFFSSILGTLNHLVVADTLWLKRFAAHHSSSTTLAVMEPLPIPGSGEQNGCLGRVIAVGANPLMCRRSTLINGIA